MIVMQTIKFTKGIRNKLREQPLQMHHDSAHNWYVYAKVWKDPDTGYKHIQDVKVTAALYELRKDEGTYEEFEQELSDIIDKQCKEAVGNRIPLFEPVV